MSATDWILLVLAAASFAAGALYLYRNREAPGRGRPLLAALRALALTLVALLLLDPHRSAGGGADARQAVLLDGSLSMSAATDGATAWERGVAAARDRADGAPVLVFGAAVRPVPADSLEALTPAAPVTRLLPALKAAAELGARRVLVVTDRGVEDAAEVARWLPRLGLELEVRDVAGGGRPPMLAELDAPAWAEAGEPVDVRFGVRAPAGEPRADSLTVVLRAGGRELGRAAVATPVPGRVATGTLRVTPPAPGGGGLVRLDAALQDATGPSPWSRSAYVRVGPRPAGVVIVSLLPDQEPRFLQPALAGALGVPVAAYLRVAEGRWVRGGAGGDAGAPVSEAAVRAALAEARVAVFHGTGSDAPSWVSAAAAAARRAVVFPAAEGAVPGTPVVVGARVEADWYLDPDVPASPVAPHLAGLETAGVPPLTALRSPAAVPEGAWAPLRVRRGTRGPSAPLALAGEGAGRRWVVALGEDYWRWAFRGGQARTVHLRLWAALAGWLARDPAVVDGDVVEPVRRAVPRGEEMAWRAPGFAGDTVRVQVADSAGGTVMDTTLVLARDGTAVTPPLMPGHYAYRAALGDQQYTGPLTVEPFAAEWVRPAVPLEGLAPAGAALANGAARTGRGAPLRSSPWPWLALLLLLATEWTLRRRWGLR